MSKVFCFEYYYNLNLRQSVILKVKI